MTREQAESERERLAREQPDVTWLIAEENGDWQIVKIGLPPADAPLGTVTVAKPKPPEPEDPRTGLTRDFPGTTS